MIPRITTWVASLVVLAGSGGCGAPFLHPTATPTQVVQDSGVTGEWATSNPADPTQVRAVITEPGRAQVPYRIALTVHNEGKFKTALELELMLTEIGGIRYADLFLARSEREALVERYGFLAVPSHQLMKIERNGDNLRVWSFDGTFLERTEGVPGEGGGLAHDRITIGGGEVTMVTAPTDKVREMIARHANNPRAFEEAIELTRVLADRPQPARLPEGR